MPHHPDLGLDEIRGFCDRVSMRPRVFPAAGLLLLLYTTAHAQSLVDTPSLMTTPVLLLNGGRQVSQGTGFFFASTALDGTIETVFLVTNFHVIAGHAPGAPQAPAGDRLRVSLHEDPNDLSRNRVVDLPLWTTRGDALWIQSEIVPAADVVLVPLPKAAYEGIRLYVFTEAHTRGDIKIRPTSGATLLGYPYGFYDTVNRLPVWKTGHVASEPSVDFEGRPVFLVDVSAFPGMSGSPVLAVANGVYEAEDGSMRTGRVLRLLGIFSSMPVVREQRTTDAGFANDAVTVETPLQLGFVWKAALIADLARNYRPGR